MNSGHSFEKMREVNPERLKRYEELCDGAPNAVSILARGLETVEKGGAVVRTKTTGYLGKEVHGNVSGSRAGVLAAIELAKYFPDARIVANSLVEKTNEHQAQVTAAELGRGGVGPERIIVQEKSFSTYSELLELIRLVTENDWQHAVVVVNEFIVPRARALLRHIHDVGDPAEYRQRPGIQEALRKYEAMRRAGSTSITVVSSEDIISLADPRYRRIVEAARQLPEWIETVRKEKSGVEAIEDGTYGKNPPSTSVKQ
ncbi:hypothetical protein A3C20_00865 [Candidatus Kaiserbacteria bacterium RIFCSPHIGHO2_02_FULL_55_25]|uniref:DUF218 domain-containing protein n=1 Tax=Candidatus Kaiserbacteria bacterium RIFCSPHIGHO2_02_FULL_55_25 TaxID=1798498 RepID=A0A1F6E6W3_9BACT|nr:MAG: hypothetical protein A2764_03905 [Candidatus Kaiserbacteria bacterium RIFCSPHIGHO2_01_FULL_55_79]OGG69439.1 MAG: hypothetical protein A3C20_00865 [Candidatus Kaiserbacteria bacterium RIFCSPHIGHO2_02_FULL_55_25]OGG77621.1 MAG: hypothetical protein A3F56_00925 [Candidatus Kaiserbacteria bacterium RIFCSPHIGHO2_12_FULL_55_13]OGG83104.1 MAG: hypothetical protein A3A42_00575 [Candidatus Kaiserbacteria bacterium RIFCSPLOWO2_01_FULL_55_25]